MTIFKKASRQLTVVYLSIIMLISIGFSSVIYSISINEVEHSLNRPDRQIQSLLKTLEIQVPNLRVAYFNDRDAIVREVQQILIRRLVLVNIGVLLGGWALSNYLAKKSLEPIEKNHQKLEKFTADASHELRTPITAIKLENELALGNNKLSIREAQEVFSSTIEELDKMTILTENLLQLSRIDDVQLHTKSFGLKNSIDSSLKTVSKKYQILNKKVTTKNNVDKSIMVRADKELISQVLIILFDNAYKYSDESLAITIDAVTSESKIILEISDTGFGISPKDAPHIFDRFYKSDESRTKDATNSTSFGLGLSIAKEIMTKHNGAILLKESTSKGSTFQLHFPKN